MYLCVVKEGQKYEVDAEQPATRAGPCAAVQAGAAFLSHLT